MTVLGSRRTVLHYVMDVLREVGGQVNPGEAQQAIQDAVKEIDQKANWEFLLAERNLLVVAPYSTGTIAGSGGSASIVGTGTVWDAAWKFRTLSTGGRLEYPISSFADPTHLTLRDALSGADAFTGQTYTIYQQRYLLPDDCEPGRDIVLKGAVSVGVDGEIRKLPRALHERRKYEFSIGSTPRWYTDGELDETTNRPTIIIYPYPTTAMELRLTYYHSFSIPDSQSALIPIPTAFEALIVLKAAANLMQRHRMPNWLEKETKANNMMTDLYNRYAASSAYDLSIEMDDGYSGSRTGPFIQDSIFYTR